MSWLLLALACAASAQAPDVAAQAPPMEIAGVPASYAAGALLFSVVLVGVLAGSGSAVLKFWREMRGPDVKQDEEIRLLRTQVNVLRALVLGKASKVDGAVGPGMAGHLLGKDHGGEGGGLIERVSTIESGLESRATEDSAMAAELREWRERLLQAPRGDGGGDATG